MPQVLVVVKVFLLVLVNCTLYYPKSVIFHVGLSLVCECTLRSPFLLLSVYKVGIGHEK